jgi:lipoprotein-anchoring transpeptidase ErfK/SrfK
MGSGLWRRTLVACAVVGSLSLAAACTPSSQAAGTEGMGQSSTGGASNQVTVAPLTPGARPTDSTGGPMAATTGDTATVAPTSDSTSPTSVSTAPTSDATGSIGDPSDPSLPMAAATVTGTPALGSTGVAPAEPITLTAEGGTLSWLTFTNPDGKNVAGALSDDGTSWTLGEPLGFGKTYTVSGVAVNRAGVQTRINGTYTTATTKEPVSTRISPGDGAVVGVAAPVMIRFGLRADDKAMIEKHVKIVTDPPVEGAWAWIKHDGDTYPSLDWRPKAYWPAGTKVHVEANMYGVKFQDGWYGGSDVSVDFAIGRNQVVKADAKANKVVVLRDGKVAATYNGSFGMGDRVGDPNLVTRSGTHVVMSKDAVYKMSNPKYGYENVTEYWAVRISNNGEFLHNNPGTTPWQLANINKTHGCINLSWNDAKAYFESAIYGDPVEITGTSIQLSSADGDIYDWAVPWSTWVTMSALAPNSTVT